MSKVTVNVTAEDLCDGRPGHPRKCPVALAIGRALGLNPSDLQVSVGALFYRIWRTTEPWDHKKIREDTALPYGVQLKINDIDGGLIVEPFSFEIDALTEEEVSRG